MFACVYDINFVVLLMHASHYIFFFSHFVQDLQVISKGVVGID
jgi:hypothetical protein